MFLNGGVAFADAGVAGFVDDGGEFGERFEVGGIVVALVNGSEVEGLWPLQVGKRGSTDMITQQGGHNLRWEVLRTETVTDSLRAETDPRRLHAILTAPVESTYAA